MAQFMLFTLLIITLIAGTYAYFSPQQQQQFINPVNMALDKNEDEMTGETSINKSQQLNVSTNNGVMQISKQIDELTQQQKDLQETIAGEQAELNSTNDEISDILKKGDSKTQIDVLKLKFLGMELQNVKSLLVDHGQQLVALNDELDKKRQLLAQERDQVNLNTQLTSQSQQDNNAMLNNQASSLFSQVKQENNDSMQRTQQMIAQQRQMAQDQRNR